MKLLVTPTMLSNAKSNKCVGWLEMNPLDFLRLTINLPNVFDWIKQEADDTKTLLQYNDFAQKGKSIHLPWLDVDIHTGKVVGHEGRHRAIAVYTAGVKTFPVAICLRDRGYPEYYREEVVPGEYLRKKVFLTHDSVPRVLIGQFLHREVGIDTNKITDFWSNT